jgi:hypothetical protein
MSTTANGDLIDQLREKVKQLAPGPANTLPPTGWPLHMRAVFREITTLIQDVPDEN